MEYTDFDKMPWVTETLVVGVTLVGMHYGVELEKGGGPVANVMALSLSIFLSIDWIGKYT